MVKSQVSNRPPGQAERYLLSQWLELRFPNDRALIQVRLAKPAPKIQTECLEFAALKALGNSRRFADALIVKPDRLILIEASIPPDPGYISRLLLYKELIPKTPDVQFPTDLPVEMIYLIAFEDPVVSKLARQAGIKVEIYQPDWVIQYANERYLRKFQKSRTGGL